MGTIGDDLYDGFLNMLNAGDEKDVISDATTVICPIQMENMFMGSQGSFDTGCVVDQSSPDPMNDDMDDTVSSVEPADEESSTVEPSKKESSTVEPSKEESSTEPSNEETDTSSPTPAPTSGTTAEITTDDGEDDE